MTKEKWTLGCDNAPRMSRFNGKTWPTMAYSETYKTIVARDNNGPNPSQSLATTDLSENGVRELLKGISLPHPTENTIKEFVSRIN